MRLDSIAVATITWVRSEAEERLLREALDTLSRHRLPVAVADKGTSPRFTMFLKGLPAFTVIPGGDGGLVAQVRASLSCAAQFGRSHILYTEPDKGDFFRARLLAFLGAAPNTRGGAGVVIAARTAASVGTYPPMQQRAEHVINDLCADVLGVAGDYSYGPFLMPVEMLPDVEHMEASLGWGWRHRVFLTAIRTGRPILHVTADHPCPPEGRAEDHAERAHRLRQLSQNILGLID